MILHEVHGPMTEAQKADLRARWERRYLTHGAPMVLVTTTRQPSRLRLAWWRLCAWFRAAVR